MRIAHEIEVNSQEGRILIEGTSFPFAILEDPEIVLLAPGGPAALSITLLASNLTYVSETGERRIVSMGSDAEELAWARRRAKEIVLEGLADVVAQFHKEA